MDDYVKIVGALTLTIMISLGIVFIDFGKDVRIQVEKDKSKIFVNINDNFVLGGTEYNFLYDGTKKISLLKSNITTEIIGNKIIITRINKYSKGPIIIDTYTFDGSMTEKTNFPISHNVRIINSSGLIYQYEVRDLDYSGKSTSIFSNPAVFGKNIKIEYDTKYFYKYISNSTKILKIKYNINNSDIVFSQRLFDPPITALGFGIKQNSILCFQESSNVSTTCGGLNTGTYQVPGSSSYLEDFLNATDGSNTTYGTVPTADKLLSVNYSKPYGATSTSLWQVKSVNSTRNYTIPINCFNQNVLMFRIQNSVFGTYGYECYNGASWNVLQNLSAGSGDTGYGYFYVYEEAMWWNISITPQFTSNINAELGLVNVIINTTSSEPLCIDILHPQYSYNYSCYNSTSLLILNITYFRKTQFNDTNTTKTFNYSTTYSNNSFGIIGHQKDQVINFSINVTSNVSENTINIYLNNTFQKSVALLQNSKKLTTFNDSNTTHTVNINTSQYSVVGYLRIPKNAIVNNANFTINGYNNISKQLGIAKNSTYTIVIEADNVNTGFFSINSNSIINYTNPVSGKKSYAIWVDNYSGEVGRAKMFKSLFFGDSSYNPGVNDTNSQNITKIRINSGRDIGKMFYYFYTYAFSTHYNYGYSDIYLDLFYSNIVSNNNVSSWSKITLGGGFAGGGSERCGTWFNPSSTTLHNLCYSGATAGNPTEDEIGTNLYADEYNNPINSTVYSKGGDSNTNYEGIATTEVILGTNYEVAYTTHNTTYLGTDVVSYRIVDFNNLGIPKISLWNDFISYNPRIEVGIIDGITDWSYSGLFNFSNSTNNLSSQINNFLSSCVANSDGFCNIPIYFYTDLESQISISNISINYTYIYNPISIDAANIQSFLNHSTNFTIIPITIENTKNSSLIINDIRYDYLGGNYTLPITVRNNTNFNLTYNITFFYSGWDLLFQPHIDFIEFIPKTPTSQNVTPYGQSSLKPIINISAINYGGKSFNFSIIVNESYSCVNLTIGINNNKSQGIKIVSMNETLLFSNISYLQKNNSIFMWTDYSCNYTSWKLWQPTFYFKACCVGCHICDTTLI
jgi:hypothetical protein